MTRYEAMRIISGKVVDGKVVIEGEPLVEGSKVTVLAEADEDTFQLNDAQEKELLEAIADADRGDLVDAVTLRP